MHAVTFINGPWQGQQRVVEEERYIHAYEAPKFTLAMDVGDDAVLELRHVTYEVIGNIAALVPPSAYRRSA